jgi:hypothetical protein
MGGSSYSVIGFSDEISRKAIRLGLVRAAVRAAKQDSISVRCQTETQVSHGGAEVSAAADARLAQIRGAVAGQVSTSVKAPR